MYVCESVISVLFKLISVYMCLDHYTMFLVTCGPKVTKYCKTQNSGLRSKEEKPRDPKNQPSRCNTQEGLLSVAQTGDSDLLGGRAPRTANWASFLYAKKTILSAYYIRVTK